MPVPQRLLTAGLTLCVVVLLTVGTAAAQTGTEPGGVAPDEAVWDRVALCETGANWERDDGSGISGGLGIVDRTWELFGGSEFAPSPAQASREQQILIADRIWQIQGWGAWPRCSDELGLAPPPTAPTEPTTTPDSTAPPSSEAPTTETPTDPATSTPATTPADTAPPTSVPASEAGDDDSSDPLIPAWLIFLLVMVLLVLALWWITHRRSDRADIDLDLDGLDRSDLDRTPDPVAPPVAPPVAASLDEPGPEPEPDQSSDIAAILAEIEAAADEPHHAPPPAVTWPAESVDDDAEGDDEPDLDVGRPDAGTWSPPVPPPSAPAPPPLPSVLPPAAERPTRRRQPPPTPAVPARPAAPAPPSPRPPAPAPEPVAAGVAAPSDGPSTETTEFARRSLAATTGSSPVRVTDDGRSSDLELRAQDAFAEAHRLSVRSALLRNRATEARARAELARVRAARFERSARAAEEQGLPWRDRVTDLADVIEDLQRQRREAARLTSEAVRLEQLHQQAKRRGARLLEQARRA